MEETDVCNLTPTVLSVQQAIPHGCAAKNLPPSQRLTLGLHALAGTQSITGLAEVLGVSRKFVYQQAATAQTALDDAFTPAEIPPMTKCSSIYRSPSGGSSKSLSV